MKHVLFVQGGGEGAHEADEKLAASLRDALGGGYDVRSPKMPDEGRPEVGAWKGKIAGELATMDGEAILVGHFVGAHMLLKYLSEEEVKNRTEGSFLARAAKRVGDTTVAEVEGRVAGFIIVVKDEVEQVYVATNHRGTRVSGVLLREAERLVRDGGCTSAWLAVVAGHARARRFYERSGWSDGGEFDYAASRASGKDGPILVPCRRYEKDVIQ